MYMFDMRNRNTTLPHIVYLNKPFLKLTRSLTDYQCYLYADCIGNSSVVKARKVPPTDWGQRLPGSFWTWLVCVNGTIEYLTVTKI